MVDKVEEKFPASPKKASVTIKKLWDEMILDSSIMFQHLLG